MIIVLIIVISVIIITIIIIIIIIVTVLISILQPGKGQVVTIKWYIHMTSMIASTCSAHVY